MKFQVNCSQNSVDEVDSKKDIKEFHFTLLRKNEREIEIMWYNTLYKSEKVQRGADKSAIVEAEEEWRNAANNKMSRSSGLAKAVVDVVKQSAL